MKFDKIWKEKEDYETCICCHRQLEIPKSLPISYRKYYIQGCGQLCEDCYIDVIRLQKEEENLKKRSVE